MNTYYCQYSIAKIPQTFPYCKYLPASGKHLLCHQDAVGVGVDPVARLHRHALDMDRTLRSPTPFLLLFCGWAANARTPISQELISSVSRMQPSTMIPAQPLSWASKPSWPPSNARRRLPPPSITSTLPPPWVSSTDRTSALSSCTLSVVTRPDKRRCLPKCRNTGGSTARRPSSSSLALSSHKSVVAKLMAVPCVLVKIARILSCFGHAHHAGLAADPDRGQYHQRLEHRDADEHARRMVGVHQRAEQQRSQRQPAVQA